MCSCLSGEILPLHPAGCAQCGQLVLRLLGDFESVGLSVRLSQSTAHDTWCHYSIPTHIVTKAAATVPSICKVFDESAQNDRLSAVV